MTFAEEARPQPATGRLAKALAGFSLGLGSALLVAPSRVAAFVGIRPTPGSTALMRLVGAQEVMDGAGIVRGRNPGRWLWSRVLGDVSHLLLLHKAYHSGTSRRARVARIAAVIGGTAILDLLASVRHRRRAARSSRDVIRTKTAITINHSPEEVYRRWRNLEDLPQFSAHVRSVEASGDGRSHWVANGPAGTHIQWDAEIVEDRPGERLAWRSLAGARVPNSGVVGFAPAPADQGTEVEVELEFDIPGGKLGRAVAKMFGEDPEQQASDDLRRFKQLVETGEVLRSSGNPEGSRTARQWHQEAAG